MGSTTYLSTSTSPSVIPCLDPESLLRGVHLAWRTMLGHMERDLPNECVGLLFENGLTIPMINQARSPDRFSVSQSSFLLALDEAPPNLNFLGFYHSHPGGMLAMSNVDKQVFKEQLANDFPYAWVVVTESRALITYTDPTLEQMLQVKYDPATYIGV